MATKIRLARQGRKNDPQYSIVVASAQAPRDGKRIEKIGYYAPLLDKQNPKRLHIDTERINFWLSNGAIPSDTILNMIKKISEIQVPAKLLKKFETKARKKIGIKVKPKEGSE